MKPDKLTVHDLFQKERLYTVPLYQRSYVWNQDAQWEPLWEDIERQAETCFAKPNVPPKHSHFLGAVVLNVQKIVGNSVARSEVIDGQQRLTTLQLFLAALRDFAARINSNYEARIRHLTTNEYENAASEGIFKVWPTNSDRALYRATMTAGNVDALVKALDVSGPGDLPRIGSAYRYFAERIEEYAAKEGASASDAEKRLISLFQAMRTGLQVVVIELEDGDDPQVIFETLNARGQPLLPSDLIRNTVFHQAANDPAHASDPTYADGLYQKYWQRFDTDRLEKSVNGEDRYWHEQMRQGRLNRPRIDLFIFHFLTMQTAAEIQIGHIFQEFRDWRDGSSEPLETFLSELTRYATIFRKLVSPTGGDNIDLFAERIRVLDTSTVYPFVLFLLGLPADRLTKAERDQVIADLEAWLVRRFICQLTNKNYNKFFVQLLNKAREPSELRLPAIVRTELRRSEEDTARWPDDTEFQAAWLSKTIYVKSRVERAVMILSAIESAMRSESNMSEQIALPKGLTVEHLLPQKGALTDYPYAQELSIELKGQPDAIRSTLIHTLGNLTLLTQALNSSISNGPFAKKQADIEEKSDLRLNAPFRGPAAKKTWDERDILERGESLLKRALKIWRDGRD